MFFNRHPQTMLLCISAFLAGPAAAADGPGITLSPSSRWTINYADDSCRLSRMFGAGEQLTGLFFEQYMPAESYTILVAGKPIGDVTDRVVKVRFGPRGAEKEFSDLISSTVPQVGAGFMVSMPVLATADDAGERGNRNARMVWFADTAARDGIEWVDVKRGSRMVRLSLGKMSAPLAALDACTTELMSHWGIDVEAHKTLKSQAQPVNNPRTWVTGDDYPAGLRSSGAQGRVRFRAMVDATGKPTACFVQAATKPAGFGELVCSLVVKRARFSPALAADGKPISSFYSQSVLFVM